MQLTSRANHSIKRIQSTAENVKVLKWVAFKITQTYIDTLILNDMLA